MIDFQNAKFIKMKQDNGLIPLVQPLLVTGENIVGAYKAMRDGVVFTDKRLIVVNIQGVTGKKKDFTSLPYSKVTAFSVETAGILDMDSELELWFSGLGRVRLEFTAQCNISQIQSIIASYAL